MKTTRSCNFSPELRKQIVREYEESDLTQEQICQKYGITTLSIISVWRKRYGSPLKNAEKVVSLQRETKMRTKAMQNASPEEQVQALKKELADTQEALRQANLKVLMLDKMIDIAERQGLKIRKNSGAKQ